jgi:hypothetical protein
MDLASTPLQETLQVLAEKVEQDRYDVYTMNGIGEMRKKLSQVQIAPRMKERSTSSHGETGRYGKLKYTV